MASLIEPDSVAMPLHFAAATAREFGARSVGLIAPYLAYMRKERHGDRDGPTLWQHKIETRSSSMTSFRQDAPSSKHSDISNV